MTSALGYILLWVTGYCAATLALPATLNKLRIASAFLFGIAALGIPMIALAYAGLYNLPSLLVIASAIAALAVSKHRREIRAFGLNMGVTLVYGMVSISVFHLWNISILSFDSYALVLLGQDLEWNGGFSDSTATKLASWGILLPVLHGFAGLFGADFWFELHGQIAASFAVSWFVALALAIRGAESVSWATILMSIFAAAALFSTHFLVFQAGYIHNSLPASALLFLAVFLMSQKLEGTDILDIAIYLPLLGFALLRTETPIAALIALSVWHASSPAVSDKFWPYVKYFAAPILIWYGYLLHSIGSGSDILTPGRVVTILTIVGGYAIVLWITDSLDRSRRYYCLAVRYLVPVFLIVLIGLVFASPEHQSISILATLRNMSELGRWGHTWELIAAGAILALPLEKSKATKIFGTIGTAMLIFIVALAATRIPYRLEWGDSGNRMLTHVAPLMWFYVVGTFLASTPSTKLANHV